MRHAHFDLGVALGDDVLLRVLDVEPGPHGGDVADVGDGPLQRVDDVLGLDGTAVREGDVRAQFEGQDGAVTVPRGRLGEVGGVAAGGLVDPAAGAV